jgi:hypothetical protein
MDPDRTLSRDVVIKAVRKRRRKHGTTHSVSWTVHGRRHHRSFHHRIPAHDLRAELIQARLSGELFDPETGLPLTMLKRHRPDLVIVERCELDRLIADSKPDVSAAAPGSWEELFAQVPYAHAAVLRGDDVLDTRRRAESLPEDAARIGFIARNEQEYHLVVDVEDLDDRAPGWRAAIDRPSDYRAKAHLGLRMLLGEYLGDAEPRAERLWFALAPVADDADHAHESVSVGIADPVHLQVSQRMVHNVTLSAVDLDRSAPGWREAAAGGHFRGDGVEDLELLRAIERLVDERVNLAEPDAADGFKIADLTY